jgi:hypothetical protein
MGIYELQFFFEKSKNTCSLILCVQQEYEGKSMEKFSCMQPILLYKATIAPHIEYCSSMWFLAHLQKMRLKKIQNKSMRPILKQKQN